MRSDHLFPICPVLIYLSQVPLSRYTKTVFRSGFSSKIWSIWYIECPIWAMSNFISLAVCEYFAFYGLIWTGTNMGILYLKSPQQGAPSHIYIFHFRQGPGYDENTPYSHSMDWHHNSQGPCTPANIAMFWVGISR